MKPIVVRHIVLASSFHIAPLSHWVRNWAQRLWPDCKVTLLPPGGLPMLLTGPVQPAEATAYVLLIETHDLPVLYGASPQRDSATALKDALVAANAHLQGAYLSAILMGEPHAGATRESLIASSDIAHLRAQGIGVADVTGTLASVRGWSEAPDSVLQLSRAGYAALATAIVSELLRVSVTPPKVIVTDCDGTLWEGECSEIGPTGVRIHDGHRAFQEFLVRQAANGVLLAVCSKNDPADVEAVFDTHPDMLLSRSHVASWAVSWDRKSFGIASIARHLGLPVGAMLMFDDEPMEREEVRSSFPSLPVVTVPRASADVSALVERCAWLEVRTPTSEDLGRRAWYQADTRRQQERRRTVSLDDFLERAEFQCDVRRATSDDANRIAQLLQRTNQFNSTKLLFGADEVAAVVGVDAQPAWVATARDSYSDYGVVATALGVCEASSVRLNAIAVSCRAIRRHVEDTLLAHVAKWASDHARPRVTVAFRDTGRNGRFLEFVGRLRTVTGVVIHGTDVEIDAWALGNHVTPRSFGYAIAPYEEDSYEHHALDRDMRSEVDPAALACFIEAKSLADGDPRAPHDPEPTRAVVERIWSEVLRVTGPGLSDEFYAVGGDSITALEMIYQINDALKIEVPLTVLFDPEIRLGQLLELASSMLADSAAAS